jgi:hypothetical protein
VLRHETLGRDPNLAISTARSMVMSRTTIRITTAARYHGLEVTIRGDVGAGLLAIAGDGTADELAISTIAVKRRRGRRVYCIAGGHDWTTSLDTVGQAAVTAREARDARVRLTRGRHER